VIGFDLDSSESAVDLADCFSSVYAVVGIHPHDAANYGGATEARIRDLAVHPRVVAIGEIGLDYHYDLPPRDIQANVFRAQVELASEFELPVVIHCRDAYKDTLDVLEGWAGHVRLGGVMHCWGGSAGEAERALALGFHLGFGGVVTFKNAGETRDIAVPFHWIE